MRVGAPEDKLGPVNLALPEVRAEPDARESDKVDDVDLSSGEEASREPIIALPGPVPAT